MAPLYSLTNGTHVDVPDHHQMGQVAYFVDRIRGAYYRTSTNEPYLSGDSFASLADYYAFGITGAVPIDSQKLAKASVIFVNGDKLDELLEGYSASINARVLITGNSDANWSKMPPLPPSVSLWLAQNCAVNDSRSLPLPIGIENLRLGNRGRKSHYTKRQLANVTSRVLVPPMSLSNPIRQVVVQKTLNLPDIFDVQLNYLSPERYFALARKYQFVLCLEGNGYENHRIWESLYFGNFPVLLRTTWSRKLASLQLPFLMVDDVSEVTLEIIDQHRQTHSDFKPEETSVLWLNHWRRLILEALGD
jgi:hypothetical protein